MLYLLFGIFLGGFVWADTNGVWHRAEDVRLGIFGGDEQGNGTEYIFINPVKFGDKLLSLTDPLTYFINISGRTQLNDVVMKKLNVDNAYVNSNLNVATTTNRAIWAESSVSDGIAGKTTANGKSAIYGWGANSGSYSGYFEGGKFYVNSDVSFEKLKSCNGNLAIDSTGKLICGTDNVNDTDSIIGNEYPIAGTGINIINSRTVNVDTNIIATRNYVNNIVSTSSGITGTTQVGPVGVNDGGAGWDANCPSGYVMSGLRIIGNQMVVRCAKY